MVSATPSNPGNSSFRPAGGEPPHGDEAGGRPAESARDNRLNLLLSCASWRDDSWADRLPFLLEPMGVHSVRARTAKQAERVIKSVNVHIAVVDLGLPLDERRQGGRSVPGEEAGPRVLDLLARLNSPPPTVVVKATRTSRDDHRDLAAALRSGAFAVVDRGAVDVEQMLEILRRCLHRFYRGRWPGCGGDPGGNPKDVGGSGGSGGSGGAGGAGGASGEGGGPRRHWFWMALG